MELRFQDRITITKDCSPSSGPTTEYSTKKK